MQTMWFLSIVNLFAMCVKIKIKKHSVPERTVGEPWAKNSYSDFEQMEHVDFINFVFLFFPLCFFYGYTDKKQSLFTPFVPNYNGAASVCLYTIETHTVSEVKPVSCIHLYQ